MPELSEVTQTRASGERGLNANFLLGWPGLDSRTNDQGLSHCDSSRVPVRITGTGATLGKLEASKMLANAPGGSVLDRIPGIDLRLPIAPASDRTPKCHVTNGVLELSFNSLARLDSLPKTDLPYTTLKINNAPPGTQILHWADESGYYFFFKGAANNNIYHYPRSLSIIQLNGQSFDIDRSRLQVNEYTLSQVSDAQHSGKNPFATVANPQSDAISYFTRMSRLSSQTLAWQENLLRKGATGSNNPYFQIYLADVLTMEALQPVVRGFLRSGQISPQEKQAILDKLNDADRQLKNAVELSAGPLCQRNKFPPGNVVMPLAPGSFFQTAVPGAYYNPEYCFWGGAWDQAQRRRTAVAFMKGLIESNVTDYFQLPPVCPAR